MQNLALIAALICQSCVTGSLTYPHWKPPSYLAEFIFHKSIWNKEKQHWKQHIKYTLCNIAEINNNFKKIRHFYIKQLSDQLRAEDPNTFSQGPGRKILLNNLRILFKLIFKNTETNLKNVTIQFRIRQQSYHPNGSGSWPKVLVSYKSNSDPGAIFATGSQKTIRTFLNEDK